MAHDFTQLRGGDRSLTKHEMAMAKRLHYIALQHQEWSYLPNRSSHDDPTVRILRVLARLARDHDSVALLISTVLQARDHARRAT
jgi:hypothetical protein